MSDAAVNPPVRIQPILVKPVSSQEAYAKVSLFLNEFQQRSTPLNGGDATVPAQLFKFLEALGEEDEVQKKVKGHSDNYAPATSLFFERRVYAGALAKALLLAKLYVK